MITTIAGRYPGHNSRRELEDRRPNKWDLIDHAPGQTLPKLHQAYHSAGCLRPGAVRGRDVEFDLDLELEAELWGAMRVIQHPALRAAANLYCSKIRSIVGLARVEFLPGGLYLPRPDDGLDAFIVGIVDSGELIDLLAVDLNDRRYATRRGFGKALGSDVIAQCREGNRPLKLFKSAWAWLQQPTGGAFIVDWRAAKLLLQDLKVVNCQTVEIERFVRRAFYFPGMPILTRGVLQKVRSVA